jgi:hypothetical protein
LNFFFVLAFFFVFHFFFSSFLADFGLIKKPAQKVKSHSRRTFSFPIEMLTRIKQQNGGMEKKGVEKSFILHEKNIVVQER